jgi:hypothetical protein
MASFHPGWARLSASLVMGLAASGTLVLSTSVSVAFGLATRLSAIALPYAGLFDWRDVTEVISW